MAFGSAMALDFDETIEPETIKPMSGESHYTKVSTIRLDNRPVYRRTVAVEGYVSRI